MPSICNYYIIHTILLDMIANVSAAFSIEIYFFKN